MAQCDNSDVATIIGGRSAVHYLNHVVSSVQTETLNTVVGGTYAYETDDEIAWLYFLEFQSCQIEWSFGIDVMVKFEDIYLDSNDMVFGIISNTDLEVFLVIVSTSLYYQYIPNYPNVRTYKYLDTNASSFY